MKKLILMLALMAFLTPMTQVMARGNHRSALDQKWKAVQAWQKAQDARFKAIEREADRAIKSLESPSGSGPATAMFYTGGLQK